LAIVFLIEMLQLLNASKLIEQR